MHDQSPTDVVFLLDESGSMANFWKLQVDYVVTVADRFKKSMDLKASQLAYLNYNSKITTTFSYSFDHKAFTESLKNHKYTMGETDTPLGIRATTDLLKTDPKTRLKETSIRKIVFICTDGEQWVSDLKGGNKLTLADLEQPANEMKALAPMTVYAIGTTTAAHVDQLKIRICFPILIPILSIFVPGASTP